MQGSSAIAILAKSEILAKRLRKELKETKSQEGQISSYDWKIKNSPTASQDRDLISIQGFFIRLFKKYLTVISPMKIKVCELATGNQYLEEWKVLPDSWSHEFATVIDTIFNKNFVLLETYDDSTDEMEGDVFLILNLVTRKRFSIGKELLEETILSLTEDAISVDMGDYGPSPEITKICQMVVGTNQIEIKYHTKISFEGYRYSGEIFVG